MIIGNLQGVGGKGVPKSEDMGTSEEGVTLEGMGKKRTLFQVVSENNILIGYCNGKDIKNCTLML